MKKTIKSSYEGNLKPMSSNTYKSMLEKSEEDYKQGKLTSQRSLEKKSERW